MQVSPRELTVGGKKNGSVGAILAKRRDSRGITVARSLVPEAANQLIPGTPGDEKNCYSGTGRSEYYFPFDNEYKNSVPRQLQ
jgi:hypothetical protein